MDIKQITENLQDISIFSGLKQEEVRKIADFCMPRTYPKNSMIILEEEFGDTVFAICEGTVKITRVNDEGKEVILALLGPGEIFGEMAIIDGESRSANALAQENCILLAFPQNEFLKILKTYFEVLFFGAFFSSYILLRIGAGGIEGSWPIGAEYLNVTLATINTVILISSSLGS